MAAKTTWMFNDSELGMDRTMKQVARLLKNYETLEDQRRADADVSR